jgi:phytoene dehydrogenase-like protein
MKQQKVVIVGAGAAGLAAGIYGQMQGYDCTIIEKEPRPGGLCTGWKRGGFYFDGCLQYLFGSGEVGAFSALWQELGLDFSDYVQHPLLSQFLGEKAVHLYSNLERTADEFLTVAPEDADRITGMIESVRRLRDFPMDSLLLHPYHETAPSLLPYMSILGKHGFQTIDQFAQKFSSPILRQAIPKLFGWKNMPAVTGLFLLAQASISNAGISERGSYDCIAQMAARFKALGGVLRLSSKLTGFEISGRNISHAIVEQEDRIEADQVIYAADLYNLTHLLEYPIEQGKLFANRKLQTRSQGIASFGLRKKVEDIPIQVFTDRLFLERFACDEYQLRSYPSNTGSTIQLIFKSDYNFWSAHKNSEDYSMQKELVLSRARDFVLERFPENEIVVEDLATSLTFEKYTSNYRGSACGWLLEKSSMPRFLAGIRQQVPRYSNLVLAGHWLMPGGGVPLALVSAKKAVARIAGVSPKALNIIARQTDTWTAKSRSAVS